MLSDEAMYERMQKGWRGGLSDGTVCGNSSTLENTRGAREWLPRMVEKYEIKTVCDAGAGDLHWIRKVAWDVDYFPFDLIPRHKAVVKFDITAEVLPPCDLILCRAVLNHLDTERVRNAIELFRMSGRYLVATQFSGVTKNAVEFCRLDLRPLLDSPLESIPDTCGEQSELALWKL